MGAGCTNTQRPMTPTVGKDVPMKNPKKPKQLNTAGQSFLKPGRNDLTPQQRIDRKREGDRIRQARRRAKMSPEQRLHIKKQCRDWENNNREYVRKTARETYHRNLEHSRAQKRKSTAKYRSTENGNSKTVAGAALARANKIRATPNWANHVAISAIYKLCAKISKETGIKHHVDHIIPLKHQRVSGLHVEYNLRIIDGKKNASKRNNFEESWGIAPTVLIGAENASTMDLEYIVYGPLHDPNK